MATAGVPPRIMGMGPAPASRKVLARGGLGLAPGPTCPAHALLTRQATLDHLLFVYRTRARFVAREFQPD